MKNTSQGLKSHRLQRDVYRDNRPVGVLDKELAKEFEHALKKINNNVSNKARAFDYWVQLFLVAVLRDSGIVPNSLIKKLEKKKDVAGLSKELNRILNENFEPIKAKDKNVVWEVYGETTRFCTRLNLLHADTLGFAYENIIRKASGKHEGYTSVYTPDDLAEEIVLKVLPTKTDSIIDTAAGTGTLLCKSAEIAWRFQRTKNRSLR